MVRMLENKAIVLSRQCQLASPLYHLPRSQKNKPSIALSNRNNLLFYLEHFVHNKEASLVMQQGFSSSSLCLFLVFLLFSLFCR
jgi:hypothetical protein